MKTQGLQKTQSLGSRPGLALLLLASGWLVAGCSHAAPAAQGPQALPVATLTVGSAVIPRSSDYVAMLNSRHAATLQAQVTGYISRILVHSGQMVKAGQLLLEISPSKQQATLASQLKAQQAQAALVAYDKKDLRRQQALFRAQVASRQALDQARSIYTSAQAQLLSLQALVRQQRQQLGYYRIAAPRAGIVGDIPVHLGDLVTTSTLLTTVNQPGRLQVYVPVPVRRAADLRLGLPLELISSFGRVMTRGRIVFISPRVDNATQTILVKAWVSNRQGQLRDLQSVKARIIWGTRSALMVPVLDVQLVNGRDFVFLLTRYGRGFIARQIPVTLGPIIGNHYPVLQGLSAGQRIIVSHTQFLFTGMPVLPLPAAPPAPPARHS